MPNVIDRDLRCLISRLTLLLDQQELMSLIKIWRIVTESLLTPAFSPLFYDTFVAFLAVFSESGGNHCSAMLVPFTFLVANGEDDVV